MLRTLFYVPHEAFGMPMFGVGLLLAIWAVISVGVLVWLSRRQGFGADTWGYVPLLGLVGAAIWLLLPNLCEPGRGFPVRGYGVMLGLAVAVATAMAVWRGRKIGLEPDLVFSLVFWGVLPGIIGARLFYVIEYWSAFEKPTLGATLAAAIRLDMGGLVVYGSLIGGMVGMLTFMRAHRLPRLATFDLLAPSMLLGLAIGRIGCLLNGCCFGGPSELPWAVTFPARSPVHIHQVHHGQVYLHGLKLPLGPSDRPIITAVQPGSAAERAGLAQGQRIKSIGGRAVQTVYDAQRLLLWLDEPGTEISIVTADSALAHRWTLTAPMPRSLPVQPTQIYSSINAMVLCLCLLAYAPFRRRDGELIALLLTVYPITRFLLEIIRTDEKAVFNTRLSISQNVSLLLLLGAAGLWFYVLRWGGTTTTRFTTDQSREA